ncbi:histone-like nucleoid-structuring protein Lsr2 [Pseudonocardia dioxanivorans]|uniref:histone-like nucleoid-structuring protein Lsr2 n=1 Tax=Pseudonocardia dioxanivorans TaxID=240495 RepID=UPI000CD10EBB|nr:Lsr2 family protein [Pseudonocardia dioxanivorans]
MVRDTITRTVDDLDGTAADETVLFSLDGDEYEIDLSVTNASALRLLLARYVAAGRQLEREASTQRPSAARRRRTSAIRQWALEQGLQVTARGRFPDRVAVLYSQRHSTPDHSSPGHNAEPVSEPPAG